MMTKEEAKEIFLNRGYIEVEGGTVFDGDKWREACSAISKWLEQEPKWVPVSERLPEERTAVLVYCPEREIIYCACREENEWWIFGTYRLKITLEVTEWMPLPEPYRAT